jgi:alpha-galactosidase
MKLETRGTGRLKTRASVLAATLIFLALSAAATAQDLNGRWAASGKTLDNGEQEKAILELKVDGGKITGTVRTMGWTNPVTGTISGNQFKIYGPWSDQHPFVTGEIVNDELNLVQDNGDKWLAHRATAEDEFPALAYIEPPAFRTVPANGLAQTRCSSSRTGPMR